MDMKLRFNDLSIEELFLMRKTGREHDKASKEFIQSCERMSNALILLPEAAHDDFIERLDKFYDGEISKYEAFLVKFNEYNK
jgi:hypothetical protein